MARGLTQRELADQAEIAEKYLSRLELGLATPSLHVAVRLAAAAGVRLETFTEFAPSAGGEQARLAPLLRLLRHCGADELERVRRVVRELLR